MVRHVPWVSASVCWAFFVAAARLQAGGAPTSSHPHISRATASPPPPPFFFVSPCFSASVSEAPSTLLNRPNPDHNLRRDSSTQTVVGQRVFFFTVQSFEWLHLRVTGSFADTQQENIILYWLFVYHNIFQCIFDFLKQRVRRNSHSLWQRC